jgi:hypothetical protein
VCVPQPSTPSLFPLHTCQILINFASSPFPQVPQLSRGSLSAPAPMDFFSSSFFLRLTCLFTLGHHFVPQDLVATWLLTATAGPHIQTSAATTNIATIFVIDNDDGIAPSADALSSAQCFMHAHSGLSDDGDGTQRTRLYARPCAHSMTTRTGRGALT